MSSPQPLFPRINHMKYKALSCQNMMMIKDEKSFTIQSPEVYQIEDSEVYLIGGMLQGGMKIEDMLKQMKEQGINGSPINENINQIEEESEEEDIEKSKNEKNIELLMSKGNISKKEATKLLEKHDGDLLKALVHLTE